LTFGTIIVPGRAQIVEFYPRFGNGARRRELLTPGDASSSQPRSGLLLLDLDQDVHPIGRIAVAKRAHPYGEQRAGRSRGHLQVVDVLRGGVAHDAGGIGTGRRGRRDIVRAGIRRAVHVALNELDGGCQTRQRCSIAAERDLDRDDATCLGNVILAEVQRRLPGAIGSTDLARQARRSRGAAVLIRGCRADGMAPTRGEGQAGGVASCCCGPIDRPVPGEPRLGIGVRWIRGCPVVGELRTGEHLRGAAEACDGGRHVVNRHRCRAAA